MLGECLFISRYQGKASRKFVESLCSTCIYESEPGKLDIKRRESGILLNILPIGSVVKLVINVDYEPIINLHVDSTSTSFKKCNVTLT